MASPYRHVGEPGRSLGPALVVGHTALSQSWVFLLAPPNRGRPGRRPLPLPLVNDTPLSDQDDPPDLVTDHKVEQNSRSHRRGTTGPFSGGTTVRRWRSGVTVSERDGDGLGPVSGAELTVNAPEMGFDRFFAKVEFLGDLTVRSSVE